MDNSFSLDFDDLEDIVEKQPVAVKVKRRKVEEILSANIKSGLALDISKTSTGIAFWSNGDLLTGNIKFEVKDYESPWAVGIMMNTLRADILSIIGEGAHLDLICVEAALLGINAGTSSIAYALNFVIDTMLAEGVISCGRFLRIENSSWKSGLREISGVPWEKKKKGDDGEKKEVIRCFQALGFPLGFKVDEFKSWTGYLRSGYQDRLDAVGLLVASTVRYIERGELKILKKFKQAKAFDSLEKAMKFAKFDVQQVPKLASNRIAKWVDEVGDDKAESKSFLMVTDNLGRWGIKNGALFAGDAYLVVNVEYYVA